MAICRICGKEYKMMPENDAEAICHSKKCWRKAWNDAIAPFKRKKTETIEIVTNKKVKKCHTTAEEKERIIELYKSGRTCSQIAQATKLEYSVVYYYLRKYEREGH